VSGGACSDWANSTFATRPAELPALEPPAAPTSPAVDEITYYSARFSWTGDAPQYDVMVADTILTVAATSYIYRLLDYSSTYAWYVRSRGAGGVSAWVSGGAFATKARPTIFGAYVKFGERPGWAPTACIVKAGEGLQVTLYRRDPRGWSTWDDVEYPFVQFYVSGLEADDYSAKSHTPGGDFDVRYFDELPAYTTSAGDPLDYIMDATGVTDGGVVSSTVSITQFSGVHLSGRVDATMLKMAPYVDGQVQDSTLIVVLLGLPVTDGEVVLLSDVAAAAAARVGE
jgi:hypothetical protein